MPAGRTPQQNAPILPQNQNGQDSKYLETFPTCCKFGKLSWASLLLSVGFFVWWLFWAWASLQKPGANLHILWLGLPLWFWISCVVSLPLLWVASLFLLPEDAEPSKTRRQRTPQPKQR